MKKELSQKLLQVQESAMDDEEYCQLIEEHEQRNALFLEVMSQLSEEQQKDVYDYFGVIIQMQQRLLMLSLEK